MEYSEDQACFQGVVAEDLGPEVMFVFTRGGNALIGAGSLVMKRWDAYGLNAEAELPERRGRRPHRRDHLGIDRAKPVLHHPSNSQRPGRIGSYPGVQLERTRGIAIRTVRAREQ